MTTPHLLPFRGTSVPPARNWFARLFRIGRRRDTQQHLERLFADRDPSMVSSADVSHVLSAAKLSGSGARKVLVAVWQKAMASFLADDHVSDTESGYLQRLRVPLGISEREVEEVQRRLVHPRYKKAVNEVLADGRLTDLERAALKRFASDLRMPAEAQALIYQPAAQAAYAGALTESMSDERVSAAEERALAALARQLGITPTVNDRTRQQLNRMALLWRIENGEIPSIAAPIALQRGETCYFTCSASWYELRTRTVRVNYSGVSTSIRICKGVRLRMGSVTPQRVTREELTPIDDGTLYITSKRVIFDGRKKNSTIRYSALLGFQMHSDGIVLEKATGKSPHLILDGDVELAAVILSSALAAS